jgi:hypothetical protein
MYSLHKPTIHQTHHYKKATLISTHLKQVNAASNQTPIPLSTQH